jgi:hypothetical protein
VTADQQYADDFTIYVDVPTCGVYQIIHNPPVPIINHSFSFSGPFYGGCTFNGQTVCSGIAGLSDFPIAGCGYVTGGPWGFTASWVHADGGPTGGGSNVPVSVQMMPSGSHDTLFPPASVAD